jgi:hypothetical protein
MLFQVPGIVARFRGLRAHCRRRPVAYIRSGSSVRGFLAASGVPRLPVGGALYVELELFELACVRALRDVAHAGTWVQ